MADQPPPRSLDELLNRDDPAWPMVREWIEESEREIDVLPATDAYRTETLLAAQVTTHSTLGAVIYETGGLFIDHHWLRLFGSGHPDIPRRASMLEMKVEVDGPGGDGDREGDTDQRTTIRTFVVGDDILGGLFGLNAGSFGRNLGDIYYYAPDTQRWEDLDMGYSEFLRWCCLGPLDKFYEDYRWEGWEEEVSALTGREGLAFWPPFFTAEFAIATATRKVVPIEELNGRFG